jgi:rare lipoprotein A
MNLYIKYFKTFILFFVTLHCNIFTVYSQEVEIGKTFKGSASYYSLRFSGRKTASGERLNNKDFTCAHAYLPFGTMIEVENPLNGKWVVVRVNDRGPFSKQRILDLTFEAAKKIGMIQKGIIKVNAKIVGKNGEVVMPRNGALDSIYKDIFNMDSLNKNITKDKN